MFGESGGLFGENGGLFDEGNQFFTQSEDVAHSHGEDSYIPWQGLVQRDL